MESGGSSNPRQIYSTRTTGIVIQEVNTTTTTTTPTATANNPTDGDNLITNLPKSFNRDADQYLPITNVVRIMRRVLPAHAKIADDAKEMIQECASEFINFITSEANVKCHREFRKTISADDLLSAMQSLGFDDYVDPLTVFLERCRAQDPERGPQYVPYARRRINWPAARMAQPPVPASPPPAPPMLSQGNVPTLPTTNNTYLGDDANDHVGTLPDDM